MKSSPSVKPPGSSKPVIVCEWCEADAVYEWTDPNGLAFCSEACMEDHRDDPGFQPDPNSGESAFL